MADFIPTFSPGRAVTFQATAAVTGGTLVTVSADRSVRTAGAADLVIGTAGFDAGIGDDVTVFLRGNGVHTLTADGPVDAGDQVATASGGTVATLTEGGIPFGVALTTSGDGGSVEVVV
ncbi:MAG: DUF2190 domain-containing protein [Actinobacteria bacterium HGW-Actinobacteria-11]|nr:MAG: DUF2190 domain-containing protein [Actinobacteria bacterium HGW-Actinobacteria-11]